MLKPALNRVDTQFDVLLQALPVDLVASAREFQAFTRARKIKTPQELLRAVLLYCGLDQSLRTVAGNLTLLEERITDSSVRALLPQSHRPAPSEIHMHYSPRSWPEIWANPSPFSTLSMTTHW